MRKIKVPTLETERLYLRMWNKKDAPALFEYAKNPNVGPWAGWKPHSDVAESKMIIEAVFLANMTWAITEIKTGRVIGSVALEEDPYRENINSRELGYSLSEDCWGKGYMTEAVGRVLWYAFSVLNIDVVMIRTAENNVRSQRVIEKSGFTYEGTLRYAYRIYDGSVRNIRCYSILREDYVRGISGGGHVEKER